MIISKSRHWGGRYYTLR